MNTDKTKLLVCDCDAANLGTDRGVPRRCFCAAWTPGSVPGFAHGARIAAARSHSLFNPAPPEAQLIRVHLRSSAAILSFLPSQLPPHCTTVSTTSAAVNPGAVARTVTLPDAPAERTTATALPWYNFAWSPVTGVPSTRRS